MSKSVIGWEAELLAMAQQGLDEEPPGPVAAESDELRDAYRACDDIARGHSNTFYAASRLLPDAQRKAIRALYAFCRITDDLVDRAQGDLAAGLAEWRACAIAWPPPCDNPVALAWGDTRARYRIPARYAEQLAQGVAADLQKTRYASFDELAVYCYGVASTVGLMSMRIVGFSGREAIPYAVKLGVAMQVTNILRDVKEDWAAGRVYLPQDELAAFGLSDKAVADGRNTQRWQEFMRFQTQRNRQLYREAMPGIAYLNPAGRLAIGAAAELYRGILTDIERNEYDVFNRRASLSAAEKLRRLPGIWLRARRGWAAGADALASETAPGPMSLA